MNQQNPRKADGINLPAREMHRHGCVPRHRLHLTATNVHYNIPNPYIV